MNEYQVFWIKEAFAYRYFIKSDILYRFFEQYNSNQHREYVNKQFIYVTREFSRQSMLHHINKNQKNMDLHIKNNDVYIRSGDIFIILSLYRSHLAFQCHTLHDAEQLLLPLLRSFHPLLFILGKNAPEFGWITPLISSTNFRKEQVLYSLS